MVWSLGRARKANSKMFDAIEESVFQRGLHQFSKSEKFLLLRGYAGAKTGSRKLYEDLQVSFLTSSFSDLIAGDLLVNLTIHHKPCKNVLKCLLVSLIKSPRFHRRLNMKLLCSGPRKVGPGSSYQ